MTFEDPTIKKKVCPVCKREFPATQAVCPTDKSMLMYVQKDELIGTVLNDRYRVLVEVGRGGMSIVYKGVHEMMDRTVAIKMLQSQHVTDQLSIKRFQQEAQAASHLQHPNIITVYDCGVVATGQPYIVMDFLEGESLTDIIKSGNHLPYQRVVPIFIQACEALEHAHQKGVIHRDLKSSNIMLVEVEGKKDFVKVVDFGIAKLTNASGKVAQNLTQTGEIFGSPIYMSPEQCLGQNLDSRSDIYSMGAMMYEALSGLPPLMGDTIYATMKMHVSQMPEPFSKARADLKIPEAVERIAFKALAKKPEQRFQTMQEFRDALDSAMRQQYETGSVPSLISAPPMMGYSTTSQAPLRHDDLEDLDLSGGLFGNDPPPVQRTTMSRDRDTASSPYISGSEGQRRTANLSPSQRGVRPPASPPESSRKTGVRKPVADRKPKNEFPPVLDKLKAILTPKVLIVSAMAVIIPAALTGLVMYFNSLGNENPFALEKKFVGVIYYFNPGSVDSRTGTQSPGFIFMRTSPPNPHMLTVNLNEVNINDYSTRENNKDLSIGNRWTVRGDRGPKDSLIMRNGEHMDDSDGQITPARELLEKFLLTIADHEGSRLKVAYETLMSSNWKKPGSADKFKDKFAKEPQFRPDFGPATMIPSCMKVVELSSGKMTILLDGTLLFQDSQYYSVGLVFENGFWKIDTFEPVSSDVWNKPIK
ncbi:MAG: serine/threonine protein kinase [Cyanobacteria bacterium SZAS LIN-3]|nr:serine/threonine protein kinase [Cyanobacteria bacterium SZAS LIN-3]